MSDNEDIKEQARHKVMIETMSEDIKEIKNCLLGSEGSTGLVIDVDRLKRSRKTVSAVCWMMFTTVLGLAATMATQAWGR